MYDESSESGLHISWAPIYHAAWDAAPSEYHEHGLVGWNRSRRLARCDDPRVRFKAYLGVQHFDPARWYGAGEPRTVFFLSLFMSGSTLSLRTYPTMADALTALRSFHATLVASASEHQ